MSCLRCGRDTLEDASFCADCILDMKNCPIPPRTAILLPKRREEQQPKKQVRRKAPSPEDQIRKLKRLLRSVTVMMILFALLAGFFGIMYWRSYEENQIPLGQNYNSSSARPVPRDR